MRLETSTTRRLRFGLVAIAALAFSIGLASVKMSAARAQSDDEAGDAASAPSATDQQNGGADQRAHDAVEAAEQALDTATDERNQLESDGAPQEQIDAANQAVSQARADKEAADEAAERADESLGEAQGQ